jgi:hypothetical protein
MEHAQSSGDARKSGHTAFERIIDVERSVIGQ